MFFLMSISQTEGIFIRKILMILGCLPLSAGLMSPNDVRYAWDIGLFPAINFHAHQMPEQNRFLGAMSNDMRYTSNCISNLEVDAVTQQNNPLKDIQYDAVQRQLEKQRIREEIIASEIERRRILELEVRRELEQEIAMQHAANRFTFQERSAMWFDQKFSFVDRVDSQLMPKPGAFGDRTMDDMSASRYPLQSFPGSIQSGINSEDGRSRIIMLVS